jgi:2,4-dienoyl-CoA reductase (NADPH2)
MRAAVDIKFSSEVDLDTVMRFNPDAVIVATGSIPITPDISGADLPNVVQARDILAGKVMITHGKSVAVIGGGSIGCEVSLSCRIRAFIRSSLSSYPTSPTACPGYSEK